MTRKSLPVSVYIPLAVGVIAISFSAIFIKLCNAPSSVIGMYRLLLTVAVFTPFAIRSTPALRRCTGREVWLLLLSGVFLGLHFLFWIDSLKHTSVASSMIITALQPVFVMAGAYAAFRERAENRTLPGMLLAVLGACIIACADLRAGRHTWFGDIESLLGTIAVSVYMLVGQGVRGRLPSLGYNTVVFAVAAAVLCVYNLSAGIRMTGYGWSDWRWFILLSIIPTVFGHALFNWLLQYISATSISVTVLGEPIGAILLANLLLQEPILLPQWIGGALCMFGVWWFLRVQHRLSRVQ